jgi:signal transduction histidine kinase
MLSGEESQGQRYEQARRTFNSDIALVSDLARRAPQIAPVVGRMEELVNRWDREVVTPNFARRRSQGFQAFAPGTAGARALARGGVMLDSIRLHHATAVRTLREEVIQLQLESETDAALGEWETFVIRAAALAIFLLLLILMMRVVSRSLDHVVSAVEALDAGRYDAARLPDASEAPNRELARLALTFDRLAMSIVTRERQLQEDIEKLKELERLKADFVSTVSHELRTPLTSMRGALGLLLGGAAGEMPVKGRELLRSALTNTDRLIRLINDILDIEKIDAGHVEIRRVRVSLRQLLETTHSGLEGFARDADVTLQLDAGSAPEVIGDPDRLIQVFTNLISNAVKFSPKGGRVEVALTRRDDRLVVEVRDHGVGIPPEFASRIFGRFQQAGGAESRRSGGTGLGLSIAKAITELHGGQIGFHPADGGGTIFFVALPEAVPEPVVRSARPAVLVVEDDESMRHILCALIEPFARPIGVADAQAAIQVLAKDPVSVVSLDHGLPDIDGLALARALRADKRLRRSTILLYSAQEFEAETLRAAGIRATDAFVKSRDPESALLDRIRQELALS